MVAPKKGAVEIIGLNKLIQNVKYIQDRGVRRAMASGVNAGLAEMARAFRREVSAMQVSSPHAASMKAGVKKAVGKRFLRGGLDRLGVVHQTVAKVGVGVGKTKPGRLSRGTTRGGIGVTSRTGHWFVLGTARMPAYFKGLAGRAAAASGERALTKAVAKSKQRLEKDAARRAKL